MENFTDFLLFGNFYRKEWDRADLILDNKWNF